MRGYVLDRYGDAAAMTLREVPAPAAAAGSVLIRVHAAGLNPIDARVDKTKLGAFADYAMVSEPLVAKMPAGLDFVQAAALPLAGLTGFQVIDTRTSRGLWPPSPRSPDPGGRSMTDTATF